MIKTLIVASLIATTAIAYGLYDDSWETAYKTDSEFMNTGNIMIDIQYQQCTYEVLGTNYKFVINFKGMNCPFSVEYNFETGKWRK